jgi:hypothetical protein
MTDKQKEIINNFSKLEMKNEERFYRASEDDMRNQENERAKRQAS